MWPIQQIYFRKSLPDLQILTSNVQNLQRIFFMTPQAADIVLPMLCISLYMNIGFSRSFIQRQKRLCTELPMYYNLPHKKLMIWRKLCFLGPTIGETSDPQNSCAEICMHPRRLLSSSWPVSGVRAWCQISTFMKTSTYMHRIMNDDLELLNPLQKFLWEE
jgi:hypothetical protein